MKNCKGCKLAKWDKTATGLVSPSGNGQCLWEMPKIVFPAAFGWPGEDQYPQPIGGYINRHHDFKDHCPRYEPE